MPVTDAERLRAAGHNVTLASGEYPLVFDFNALFMLEKEFDSLSGIQAVLDGWIPKAKGKGAKREIEPGVTKLHELRPFMVAGLAHVPLTADEVVRGFLLSQLSDYQVKVMQAIGQGFSAPDEDGQGNALGEAVTPSNGTSTTSSPPSDTAGATTTSGG